MKLTVTSPDGTNTRIKTDYINVAALPTTLTPVADSYVRSNAATTNYGSAADVEGYNTTGRNKTTYLPYVRFTTAERCRRRP